MPRSFTVPYDGSGSFENYGICHDCHRKIEIESMPSANLYGRAFWPMARPEQRTSAHPANLASKYIEIKPGWYEAK